jgi:hypothetical protein
MIVLGGDAIERIEVEMEEDSCYRKKSVTRGRKYSLLRERW